MHLRPLLVVSAALTLFACNPAYRQRVDSAKAALREGDAVTALRLYGEACELLPDSEACDEQAKVSGMARARQLPLAQASCAARRFGDCLAQLSELRAFGSTPEVSALAETAMRGHQEVCHTTAGTGLLAALQESRCISSLTPVAKSPGWTQLDLSTREQAARLLLEEARKVETPGSAWAYSAAARCYSATDVARQAQAAEWSRFVAANLVGTSVTLDGVPDGRLCGLLSRRMTERLDCAKPARLTVAAQVVRADMEHTVRDSPHTVQYVVRTDRVPNRQWAQLAARIDTSQATVNQLQRDLAAARADCLAKVEGACARSKAVQASHDKEGRHARRAAGRAQADARGHRDAGQRELQLRRARPPLALAVQPERHRGG